MSISEYYQFPWALWTFRWTHQVLYISRHRRGHPRRIWHASWELELLIEGLGIFWCYFLDIQLKAEGVSLTGLRQPNSWLRKWPCSTNYPGSSSQNNTIMTSACGPSSRCLSWLVHSNVEIRTWVNSLCWCGLSETWIFQNLFLRMCRCF